MFSHTVLKRSPGVIQSSRLRYEGKFSPIRDYFSVFLKHCKKVNLKDFLKNLSVERLVMCIYEKKSQYYISFLPKYVNLTEKEMSSSEFLSQLQ